jgi:hypothetical protein
MSGSPNSIARGSLTISDFQFNFKSIKQSDMETIKMNVTRVFLPALALLSLVAPAAAAPLGAPMPLIGAGLPGLAVGYGVYWLIKRRRNSN